ncbi:MAG: AbrB/MazE/SpoVT family DNA-binding domain-containing protein [Pseudomonadota bacterium]
MLVTVTDKGQLTVPKAIREQFGIEPGTKLDFEAQADGTLRVHVLARGAGNLFGLLQRPGRQAKTTEDMDTGIADAALARAKRSRS